MDVSSCGSGSTRRSGGGVVAGSVWERRMRSDQVKGGIKIFGIVDGLDDDEDRGVKINRTGNLEKESSTTVRKRRRTWKNRDEQGKSLDLHPVKEFDQFEEVGGDKLCRAAAADDGNETCKDLGVCHVGRVKSGSAQKGQQKFREFGNGGSDDDDVFFDDEGLKGDVFNYGNEEVDFKKSDGPAQIQKHAELNSRKQVSTLVETKKVINNHFSHDGKSNSLYITNGSPPSGGGVHKECRNKNSRDDGCLADVRIVWQSLVDLVMWSDVGQTAFVFGLGTLVLILSFFTGKSDISFVSLISHLGFFALATIFMCKSIFSSYRLDQDKTTYAVREEEALNFTRSVLPYINKFLLMFRTVLSGDPAITLKLVIVLYVIARWVDYLSLAAILKLGFFAAFTVPRLYSKYLQQRHGLGKSWIQHIEDTWALCSHKSAVALVAFLTLWNFSSAILRVYLAFLLYLALRYHEHSCERYVHEQSSKPGDHRGKRSLEQKTR